MGSTVGTTVSEAAQNVLVVGPAVGEVTDELCTRLLTDVQPADSILGVSVVQSPSDRRRRWTDHGSLDRFDVEFVDVDTDTRAASAVEHSRPRRTITTVSDPTDLATLGRTISERLAAGDGQTSMCFHSMTDILDFVERERALEFLHTLAEAVKAADAHAHYHLDASQDEETVELFRTVTDRVIELSPDGSDVSVR